MREHRKVKVEKAARGNLGQGPLDWSQCPAVESVPGKFGGAWVLRGTRMPVAVLLENLEAGATIDNLMKWFDGLNRKQVRAVMDFAGQRRNPDETLFF